MNKQSAETFFGRMGVFLFEAGPKIREPCIGTTYSFMEGDEYDSLLRKDIAKGMKVFWVETLERAHMAAASGWLRHLRWFDACLTSARAHPNFLGFAGALRGLVEACADTWDGLRGVPSSLADYFVEVQSAIRGERSDLLVIEGLEDSLIHFQFARKWAKGQQPPPFHHAKSSSDYLKAVETDGKGVAELYSTLCQLVHPAGDSMGWLFEQPTQSTVRIVDGGDLTQVRRFSEAYADAIEGLQQKAVNVMLMTFKVLNAFDIPHLQNAAANGVNLSNVPGWARIESALSKASVRTAK